ncbi:MAG: CHAD domain-containing protein [Actinomycetota bacterium]|nr:CHAD domain-containing protein [Actinomycetota bacterium]
MVTSHQGRLLRRCCEGKIKARYFFDESSGSSPSEISYAISNCTFEQSPTIESGVVVLLDSLRWSIFTSQSRLLGLISDEKGYQLQLTTSSGQRYTGSIPTQRAERPRRSIAAPFAYIEPTTLRNKVANLTLPFGLLAIAETTFERSSTSGYNQNGRQIVKVERLHFDGAPTAIIEVLGDSESAIDEVAEQLGIDKSVREVSLASTVELIASLAKRRPNDFAASFEIGVGKKLNDALFDLLKRSIPSLKLAYDAVLQEVDEESLHDLRVIARSIKSIFSAAARYVPSDEVADFLEETSNLITVTTAHRDIDVAIEYLSQFPSFEGACNVLEDRRRDLTRSFQIDLQRAIESVTATWKIAAAHLIVTSSRDTISVEEFYDREAKRVHGKIVSALKKGEGAKGLSIDELHTLRKRFKKLRYLTETFHRNASADPLAITSKSFQTSLGLLQDCQVLLDLLLDIEEQAGANGQSVEAAILHSQERLEAAKTESLAKLEQLLKSQSPSKVEEVKKSTATSPIARKGKKR